MILKFTVKNYRSYKEETTFSMEANASEHKMENVIEFDIENQNYRVLKSAMIYGPNASGKSNIIRAFKEFRSLILEKNKVDERINIYDPFKFELENKNKPCEFTLTFIGPKNIKYQYNIVLNEYLILEEQLLEYQIDKYITIFERLPYNQNNIAQKGNLHIDNNKEVNVFSNQLILSKFGYDEPHEILTPIFKYFEKLSIFNNTNALEMHAVFVSVAEKILNDKNIKLQLSKLIKAADTKVLNFEISKSEFDKSDGILLQLIGPVMYPYNIIGVHEIFSSNNEKVGLDKIHFTEESIGTQNLFCLGGLILLTLENG